MILQGQVGAPQASITTGTNPPVRQGQLGDVIVSELHGRFYEQAYRGSLYKTGTTTIVAVSATQLSSTGFSGTLATAATGTPMLGIWNPLSSGVNVVMLQAALQQYIATYAATTPFGAFIWGMSVGNAAISTGLIPISAKTGVAAGSQSKVFLGATALTGLTNVFLPIEPADFAVTISPVQAAYGTLAAGTVAIPGNPAQVQNFDGQLIVPPGGVLALYSTATGVNVSFTGRLLWEEVAV